MESILRCGGAINPRTCVCSCHWVPCEVRGMETTHVRVWYVQHLLWKFLIQKSPNSGFTLQKFSRMSMTNTVMIQVWSSVWVNPNIILCFSNWKMAQCMLQTRFVKCLSWERVFWIFTKAVITRNIKKEKWREAPMDLAAEIYISREYMQSLFEECHKNDKTQTPTQATPPPVKFHLSVVKTKFLNRIFFPFAFFPKQRCWQLFFNKEIFFLAFQNLLSHFLKLLWWLESANKSSWRPWHRRFQD